MKQGMIFVFGSNEAGIHGAGAALEARKSHGAKLGIGFGHVGNSFAIPTKDEELKQLPLRSIRQYVRMFLAYAEASPDLIFQVTRIGCGLAGYSDKDIAPMFKEAPDNCVLPEGWRN